MYTVLRLKRGEIKGKEFRKKGEFVHMRFDKDNKKEQVIRVYFNHSCSNREIGLVSATPFGYEHKSPVCSQSLYERYHDDNKTIVEKAEIIDISDEKGELYNFYTVLVKLTVEDSVEEQENNIKKGEIKMTNTITLKVAGSLRAYKSKNAVIRAYRDNGSAEVKIQKGEEADNGFLLTFDDKKVDSKGVISKAGVIRAEGNTQTSELADLLKIMPEIVGIVTSVTDTTYTFTVKVDDEITEAAKTGIPVESLKSIMDKLVDDGISTKKNLTQIVKYLKNSDVSERRIKDIFKTYKVYDKDAKAYIPVQPKTVYVDEHRFVKSCVTYIMAGAGTPLRFSGEAGTGKNLMVTTLAWLFQRPLFEKAVNSEFDKFDLLGSKTTDITLDSAGNQQTKIIFEIETFIRAMEVGGFCNLDEINTGHPGVLTLIHPVIDGRSYIDVPGYGRVVAKENFGIFSTMNYGYAGTQALNKATKDRFTTIVFPMNKSIKSILKGHDECQGASEQTIEIADKLYKDMHRMVEASELDEDCMTIRGFIKAVRFSEENGMKDSFIHNIANGIDEPDFRFAVIDQINNLIR